MNTFNATFRRMAETIFQPRPKEEVWEWADRNVKIPEIVGSLNPGQVNTGRLRFWRLVWQLYWRKRTRFITIQGRAFVPLTAKGLGLDSSHPHHFLFLQPKGIWCLTPR